MTYKRAWGHWFRPWDWDFGFFGRALPGETVWAIFHWGLGWDLCSQGYKISIHLWGFGASLGWFWQRDSRIPWLVWAGEFRWSFCHRPFPEVEAPHATEN